MNIPALAISVGGCIGDCNQFISGAFTINGVTYNAYYRGHFNFSQVTFQIPKIARRKGLLSLRKPFTLDGYLEVCQVSVANQNCPADKILFSGDIKGGGALTVTGQIRIYNQGDGIVSLQRKSPEYQFEP